MGQNVVEFTDANFDAEVLQSDRPVLVDFWAPWCGPCRQIAPMIDELANQYADSIKIGKLNVDENPETARKYGIQGIPTLLLFKNGEVVDQFVGIPPKVKLEETLNSAAAG